PPTGMIEFKDFHILHASVLHWNMSPREYN
ncbi:uncharacterized protein METZ01_LOCUS488202, partial [marine metagenome]